MNVDLSSVTPTFLLLWIAMLLLCVIQIAIAFRSNIGILGFVPAICTMFFYLFVIQAIAVVTTLGHLTDTAYFEMGEFVALLALVGVLAGWYRGLGQVVPSPPAPFDLARAEMLWYCGILVIMIGAVASYVSLYYLRSDFTAASAYVHLLFHVAYPGLAICVYLASYDRQFRSSSNLLVLIIVSSIFIFPWIYLMRRGPTFTFLVIIIYSFYLGRPRKVNRTLILSGLAFACVTMLFFFAARDYYSEQGPWSGRRMADLDFSNVLLQKAYEEGDNEFLYNCCFIGACYEHEKYQWGTSYLSLSVHWIPRSWWPDKPPIATGWYDPLSFTDVRAYTGVLPSGGSAMTGIAESFLDFGWLTPVFWFSLGWGFGRMYRVALTNPFSCWVIVYVGMVAASHYLVTQGFAAFFVPAMCYLVLPIMIYTVVGRLGQFRPNQTKKPRPAPRISRFEGVLHSSNLR